MAEPRALELEGHRGQPLPCVLYEADAARGSAVVFPGGSRAGHRLGGTPARPDLSYTRALLLLLGLSVLEVWWHADTAPDGDDGEAWLAASARAALTAAADVAPPRAAVARSWGARALAKLVLVGSAPATTIWIAPLLGHPEVREALERAGAAAVLVAGTADELVPAADMRAAEAAGVAVVAVRGGNHGLEVGDPAASARALADVLDALRGFLQRSLAAS